MIGPQSRQRVKDSSKRDSPNTVNRKNILISFFHKSFRNISAI